MQHADLYGKNQYANCNHGYLRDVSKPLTIERVEKRHSVTVISSMRHKQEKTKALHPLPTIGSLEDT